MIETINVIFWLCMFGCGLMVGLLWQDKEVNKRGVKIILLENQIKDLRFNNDRAAEQFEKKVDDLHKEIDRLHRKYGE